MSVTHGRDSYRNVSPRLHSIDQYLQKEHRMTYGHIVNQMYTTLEATELNCTRLFQGNTFVANLGWDYIKV